VTDFATSDDGALERNEVVGDIMTSRSLKICLEL